MNLSLPVADDSLPSARTWPITIQIAIGLGCCVLASGMTAFAVSRHCEASAEEKKRTASSETIERHRDISRLLMHATLQSDLKQLSGPAFKNWMSIAKVTDESGGGKRYAWTNYSAKSDGPHSGEGDPVGEAWLILNRAGEVQEIGYISAEY